MFYPIFPEILLLILGLIVLVLDLILPKEKHRNLGLGDCVGMGLMILLSLTARPG